MKQIVVNAIAAKNGGALSILKQFISSCIYSESNFIIFCSDKIVLNEYKNSNVKIIYVKSNNWIHRIYWDFFGFKKRIKNNNIKVDVVLSLQNTTVNFNAKQFIYLHQSLVLSNIKWSVLKKNEFRYFLYAKLYHFFIFIFARKDTEFFVQTNWMKKEFEIRYNYKCNLIEPLNEFNVDSIKEIYVNTNYYFYPASFLVYKNHEFLLNVIAGCVKKNPDIKLGLTLKYDESEEINIIIKKLNIESNIIFLGTLTKEQMIDNYQKCNALLFPSYLESLGLPLVEAACLGKRIICSDLNYSHDVLDAYQGVTFLDIKNKDLWVDEIINKTEITLNFKPLRMKKNNPWIKLHKIIEI